MFQVPGEYKMVILRLVIIFAPWCQNMPDYDDDCHYDGDFHNDDYFFVVKIDLLIVVIEIL